MHRFTMLLACVYALLPRAGIAQAPGAPLTPPAAYLERVTVGEESWFTNQFSRDFITVRLIHVSNPVQCLRQQVVFTFLTSGATGVIPSVPVPAVWETRDGEARCEARIRWRLGDTPGMHHLTARLVRDTASPADPASADRQTVQFRATAHLPPNLIIGLARDPDRDDEKRYTAIVGADFPIVYRRLEALYPALNNVRVSLATQFGADAGRNLYVGLQLFPLVEGPRVTAFPLQLTAGYRTGRGKDGAFVAAHYNASGALASVLTGFVVK